MVKIKITKEGLFYLPRHRKTFIAHALTRHRVIQTCAHIQTDSTHTYIKTHNHINMDTQTQMTYIDQGVHTQTHRIPDRETHSDTQKSPKDYVDGFK